MIRQMIDLIFNDEGDGGAPPVCPVTPLPRIWACRMAAAISRCSVSSKRLVCSCTIRKAGEQVDLDVLQTARAVGIDDDFRKFHNLGEIGPTKNWSRFWGP